MHTTPREPKGSGVFLSVSTDRQLVSIHCAGSSVAARYGGAENRWTNRNLAGMPPRATRVYSLCWIQRGRPVRRCEIKTVREIGICQTVVTFIYQIFGSIPAQAEPIRYSVDVPQLEKLIVQSVGNHRSELSPKHELLSLRQG